jgi:hypothetical protein
MTRQLDTTTLSNSKHLTLSETTYFEHLIKILPARLVTIKKIRMCSSEKADQYLESFVNKGLIELGSLNKHKQFFLTIKGKELENILNKNQSGLSDEFKIATCKTDSVLQGPIIEPQKNFMKSNRPGAEDFLNYKSKGF